MRRRIVDADRVPDRPDLPHPLDVPYRERESRVLGAVLWRRRLTEPRTLRVLPDGCVDLIWRDGALMVAGPDRHAFVTRSAPGASYVGLRLPPGDVWRPALARRAADAVAATGAAGLEDVVLARLAEHEPDPMMTAVVR